MGKYKFSLAPQIKSYVEWQLSHYHEDKRQLEQYKSALVPPITQQYSSSGGASASGDCRKTENAAIKIATSPYILQLERSCDAIGKVLSRCEDLDKSLIELVYWRGTYTPEGAGLKLHLSRATAYRRINGILTAIALEMGYVNV